MRNNKTGKFLSGGAKILQRLVLLSVMFVGITSAALAQGTIKGKVTDDQGNSLPGANVFIKGTTQGTISDMDGNYQLDGVPAGNNTLVVSFIGFADFETNVGLLDGQTITQNVSLSEDSHQIEEVVAVGYGVQKKKLVTGATVQVKGDDIQKMNTTNPLQALQGQTPGVNITSTSGQPGAAMSVSIRGLGTVGNAQPLYLIDGVGGDITTLNPADIESIDVLKDAASAAIYGAQAANGVVLITTKSGKEGKSQVSLDAYYGIQTVARKISTLDANDFMTIMDEAAVNSGNSRYNWASYSQLFYDDGFPKYNTDWIDEMFADNTTVQSYNLSITGGNKTSNYATSFGYMDQEGIVGGADVSNYRRYNYRINSEHKLFDDYVTIGEHVGLVWKEQRGMNTGSIWANNLYPAFFASPIVPVYNEDGTYFSTENDGWNVSEGNPYANMMLNRYNKTKSASVDANVYAQVEPMKGLKVKTVYGISYGATDYRSFTPIYSISSTNSNTITKVNQSNGHGISQTWTNTVSYDWKLFGDHSFNALLGMESTQYDGNYTSGYNTGLTPGFDSYRYSYLSNTNGTDNKSVSGGPYDASRGVSYFARLGWNWKETYMLNATVRCDGSSRFAEGHRYGWFPSVSAGWVITNEEFMQGVTRYLNFLKIRGSWGQVGNSNIGNYQYLSPVTTEHTNYNFGIAGGQDGWTTGSYASRLANEAVTWETSEQLDLGFDARLFNSRLNIAFDWYKKSTKDWLVQPPILATSGAEAPFINGGDVDNTGVEIAATWNQQIKKDLSFSIGGNFAYNKNEVGNIPTEDGVIHPRSTGDLYSNSPEYYRAQNGHAIGYFYGYKTAGIFQNQQEIDEWVAAGNGIKQANVRPGDVKFVDVNHDGQINEDDKVDLGCGIPSITYGVNFSVNYKGFDLSATATGAANFKIVQAYGNGTGTLANYTETILDRWTGEGTSNKIPRVLQANNGNWDFSDLYMQDGDYFRIQNVTLGYDFKRLISWKYISQCRLYFQVQNLYTFTKYTGMDPEIGSYNGTDGNSSDSWVSGVDMGYYPHPRTFLFGINLKF